MRCLRQGRWILAPSDPEAWGNIHRTFLPHLRLIRTSKQDAREKTNFACPPEPGFETLELIEDARKWYSLTPIVGGIIADWLGDWGWDTRIS
jgi:hypothetical protein